MSEPTKKDLNRPDAGLIALFETTELPFEEWTHRAHLRVAIIYLRNKSYPDALDQIREGIQRYNLANNVPSTPTSGYHETVTVTYMRLVAALMKTKPEPCDSEEFLKSNPELLNKSLLLEFFSKDVLMSEAARKSFVPPNQKPLPDWGD